MFGARLQLYPECRKCAHLNTRCQNPAVVRAVNGDRPASPTKGPVVFANLLAELQRYTQAALESPSELFAILSVVVAAGFVLVSSFVKTMIPLRWLAIGSSVGFVAYGALHPS